VFVENDVVIGDRVTVKCGVQLWDGVRIEDDVFVGPNATFTNDIFPRSKQRPERFATTVVERGASIGANSTILPGITIGAGAMIGAGAVVLRSVPRYAIVVGNPARIVGYANTPEADAALAGAEPQAGSVQSSRVRGVSLHRLPRYEDMRGALSVAEFARDLPFVPQRHFLVYGVPSAEVRGEHAHRHCAQFLICVHGQVCVIVDDGTQREEYLLDAPHVGVYMPPRIWGTQYRYSSDAVLLVFASHPYDAADYIRDYDTFLREVRGA
jgi:carbonic anhydrase/acetyltransferase-like protein (isoleucine patch superfamily)